MAILNVAGTMPSVNDMSEDVNELGFSADFLDVEINHKTPEKISVDACQIAQVNHKAEPYRIMAPAKQDVDTIQATKAECEKKREQFIENKGRKGEDIGHLIGSVAGFPIGVLVGGGIGNFFLPGFGTIVGAVTGGTLGISYFGELGDTVGRYIAEKSAKKAYFCSLRDLE